MELKLTPRHLAFFRRALKRKLASRRVPCPLCGSRRAKLLHRCPNVRTPVFSRVLAERIEACEDCGFVFTNPRLSAEDLGDYYATTFRLEGLDVPRTKEEFLSDAYKEIWLAKDRDLGLILKQKQSGRLLDVGCASGSLLYLAREKGFACKGVELGREAAEFAAKQLGLDVFCGPLERAAFRDGEFDVVTAIHVLEHIPDPNVLLAEVHRILSEGGVLIGVVPNLAGWSARMDGGGWRWLQPQDHYSHFTPKVLKAALERHGFLTEIGSDEGRYGADEIKAHHRPEEIASIHKELKGSEIVFAARKQSARRA
ncbi:MAG TPA: class I SAM-dependent methyltransferase [Candidatus Polarisedimenticolia bacterium]|nr:class I SAM-dependent methyltransferase [Candidatus Polarisedimenticolia bacterium]